ncbi:MAG: cyclic nucleotide-binding domain-containing protein, partial [Flavobacteriales bacterium]|nr:cyclic nucleotide-binding domain-containing protein [Flavobacteriales bacterium]
MHIESFLRQLFETDRPRFEVSRNQILTSIGDIEDRIFYIHEGAVCAFYLHDGQEQVIRLGYKGSVINALPSFYERTPSQLEIRAIRDSVCSSIDREAFISIALDEAHIHSYMELLQQLICQQMERELD